jgi:hypothetical protein
MSTRQVRKLRDSRLELQEEEEQAEEEATAEEKEEQAKEKEQAERFTIKLFPTLSSRLVTKLWVNGREKRASQRQKGQAEIGSH